MTRWYVNGVILEEGKTYTNKSGKTRVIFLLSRDSNTFKISVSWGKDIYSNSRVCSAEAFVKWLKA